MPQDIPTTPQNPFIKNQNIPQNSTSNFPDSQAQPYPLQNGNNHKGHSNPPYVTADFDMNPDFLDPYMRKLQNSPGRYLYFLTLFLSLLFTLFPWASKNLSISPSSPVFSIENVNYFYFIGVNFFTILYIFALLMLTFIRICLWLYSSASLPYKKILEYIEILLTGGIVMFVLTLQTSSPQIGLFLSIFTNMGIFSYITYLKFIKK
jgi:hypothetical protein